MDGISVVGATIQQLPLFRNCVCHSFLKPTMLRKADPRGLKLGNKMPFHSSSALFLIFFWCISGYPPFSPQPYSCHPCGVHPDHVISKQETCWRAWRSYVADHGGGWLRGTVLESCLP